MALYLKIFNAMRIGIVCEGPSDAAVIINILKGTTGLDSSNFVPILPVIDNTSKAHLSPDTFSSWTVVLKECTEKKKILPFLGQRDSTHLVIQIDTAEANDYGIDYPNLDDPEYCLELRGRVIEKIAGMLGEEIHKITLYAIAIHEIDSWVLTIFEQDKNCFIKDSKKQLQKTLYKQKIAYKEGFKNYLAYSDDFRNSNKTRKRKYLECNCSLRLFWEETESKFNQ